MIVGYLRLTYIFRLKAMLDLPIYKHFNKENWKTVILIYNINLANKNRNL